MLLCASKMVVFGDSASDTGRRFNAPASFQFEDDGIGPFPWKRLYDGPDSDVSGFFSGQSHHFGGGWARLFRRLSVQSVHRNVS